MNNKTFIKTSPLVTAQRYALRDLQGRANYMELKWLNVHLIMWLRALNILESDVENQIAKSKKDSLKFKPRFGEAPSQEHKAAQENYIKRRTDKLHFLKIVKNRREEVKALIGTDSILSRMTMGELVSLMLEIDELVKIGDTVELRRFINGLVKLWTTEMLEGKQ